MHTISVVLVQAVSTPAVPPHARTAQVVHGVLPEVEKVPVTHGATASLHTVFVVGVQAALTPGTESYSVHTTQCVMTNMGGTRNEDERVCKGWRGGMGEGQGGGIEQSDMCQIAF